MFPTPCLGHPDMAFLTHRTVRFGECDPARIVYFSRYFEYAHEAYEDLLEAGQFPLKKVFHGDWGMPLVRAESDFSMPSRLGDKLCLSVSVDRVGNRSIRYAVEVLGEDGKQRARLLLTHACILQKTGKTCAVPGELLDALRRAGALSD